MARALDLESQHWAQGVAPQQLDGHCHSELAIDVIQVARPALLLTAARRTHGPPLSSSPCALEAPSPPPALVPVGGGTLLSSPPPLQIISQSQAKAESITAVLGTQIKCLLRVELAAFLRR